MKELWLKALLGALLIIGAAALMFAIRQVELALRKRGKVTDDELDKFHSAALQVLSTVGLALFTDAENQYGAGTGALKKASVMYKLLQLLPDDVQRHISMDWLSAKAEYYLELAKVQWEKNGRLVK